MSIRPGGVAGGTSVAQTITNSVTDSAPSQDAVFDALALKAPVSATWLPTTAYKAGQVVVYNGIAYAALADFTSGASFNASNWTRIAPGSNELGYAERTSNDTTTNASYATSTSNKISGLSVTVAGEGLPVLVEFFCPSSVHSVANSAVNVTLIIGGALTGGQIATANAPSTSTGEAIIMRRRLVLTADTSYTFEVGKYLGAAGTGTYTANANYPMHLAVTR